MQIGIIGAGSVGGTLGAAWARKGHKVRFGVRHPDSPEMTALLKKIGPAAAAGTVAEAAHFGEAVVLATPWPGTFEAIQSAGDLSEKVLLDCTNPLKPQLAGLEVGHHYFRRRDGGRVGRGRARRQDFQYHRLRQHGESELSAGTGHHVLLRRR